MFSAAKSTLLALLLALAAQHALAQTESISRTLNNVILIPGSTLDLGNVVMDNRLLTVLSMEPQVFKFTQLSQRQQMQVYVFSDLWNFKRLN